LNAEMRACEVTYVAMTQAEANEARAAAEAGEAQSELHVQDNLAAVARQRLADLEADLLQARVRLEQLDGQNGVSSSTIESLRSELCATRMERDDIRRERDKILTDQSDLRHRADRGAPQLSECRRRLKAAEDKVTRTQAEVAKEKHARERCHTEAIRANERLRLVRSQCEKLRTRVRALEEAELRYPSRCKTHSLGIESAGPRTLAAESSIRSSDAHAELYREFEPIGTTGLPGGHHWPPPQATEPVLQPVSSQHLAKEGFEELKATQVAQEIEAVRQFVEQEDQRLASLGTECNDLHNCPSSEDLGLAELLATEPRVLRLPEPLQLSNDLWTKL